MQYFAGPVFIPILALFAIGIMIFVLASSFIFTIVFRIVKHRFPSKRFFVWVLVILGVLFVFAYVDDMNTKKAEQEFYGRNFE